MFGRFIQSLRSARSTATTAAPIRGAMLETLEDRQLYSVSPLGQLPAVQQPTAVERQLPAVQLPAVQQPGSSNIIAILIGL
jgi:hypothetical protein